MVEAPEPGRGRPGPLRPDLGRKKSVSRAIYLVILIVLAAAGVRVLFNALFFVTAYGVFDLGEIQIGAERAGRVAALHVESGDVVKEGSPLATLFQPAQEAEATLARAAVCRLRSEIVAEGAQAQAVARAAASRDRSEASRLRDRALSEQAAAVQARAQIAGLLRQAKEAEGDLAAREKLAKTNILVRPDYLELRLLCHDIRARIAGLQKRTPIQERNIRQLEAEARALGSRAETAEQDALAAGRLASLRAQLVEAEAKAALHTKLARVELTAPIGGTVSWVDRRMGEFVAPGATVLRLVPAGPPRVIAYPGDALAWFPLGTEVDLQGPTLSARGVVERVLPADRASPRALLEPYQQAVVGPALVIRVDRVLDGALRAGAIVEIRRGRLIPW